MHVVDIGSYSSETTVTYDETSIIYICLQYSGLNLFCAKEIALLICQIHVSNTKCRCSVLCEVSVNLLF